MAMLTWKKMRCVCAHIAVLLTILQVWAPTTANNRTDKNEEYRSSLQVNGSAVTPRYHRLVNDAGIQVLISGRPTLAKVVVLGTFFILMALGAGLWLFCYIYRRHKRGFAEIEEDLLAGRRCFKPQLEDPETVFFAMHVTRPVTFMRKVISSKIRRRKVDEVEESEEDKESEEDEEEEEEEEEDVQNGNENLKNLTQSPGGLMKPTVRKTRKEVNYEEEPENESQVHGGDPRKPNKNELQGKAKASKGQETHKEMAKTNEEKGEKSEKSDPTKKDITTRKNLDLKKKGRSEQPDHKKKEAGEKPDKSAVGKTMKDPRKKTEKKTKKEDKSEKKDQKPKAQKLTVKKQEAPKKVKTEKVKATKPNKTKTKKATKEKNSKKKFGGFFNK